MSNSILDDSSSSFSLPKTALTFGILILISLGLSFLYGAIGAVLPFVYVNFLIPIILAVILGYFTIAVNYFTKQTHRMSEFGVTAAFGLITWYFSWVAFILFLNRNEFDSVGQAYFHDFTLIFEPLEVFRIIGEIYKVGLWEFDGVAVNGSPLTFIWILEALILIIVPLILVFKQHIRPFSSAHNKWYREFILDKDFGSVYGRPQLKEDLKSEPIKTLEDITFGKANLYTQVSIFFLEEESTQFISLFDIRIDQKNNKEKNEIIHMMEITSQDARTIMKNWHAKKTLIPFL